MFGGKVGDYIPVYASFNRYKTIDDVVKAVGRSVERGFKLIKIHNHIRLCKEQVREKLKEVDEGLRKVHPELFNQDRSAKIRLTTSGIEGG